MAICCTPKDIFLEPHNRFVAEFIGSMVNLYLEGSDGLELQVQKSYADYNRLGLIAGQQVFAEWSDSDALMLRSSL